ncbi:MAG: Hsp70 family protein, partial [Chitinivibrionales bacterium]|nr:Hsp70 family protein [Chitinivibrionales bacterium]
MAVRARYAIGIDLGTSNCALAYIDLREPDEPSRILEIPQWETSERSLAAELLPSFAFLTGPGTLPGADKGEGQDRPTVGLLARNSAIQHPDLIIHSAKSWLSHSGIDREARILPWHSASVPSERKLSPVETSALYLGYLRAVWDQQMTRGDETLSFDNQQIVVTVPASFDQDAQRLTLEAARLAGYPSHVRLLEEPQAAFHAWTESHPQARSLQDALGGPRIDRPCHVLVCDVGGGTTDLSLFSVTFLNDAPPSVERVAVSEHILLGGDNIDLALAHHLEQQLSSAEPLSPRAWQSLVNRCRDLKEQALGGDAPGDREYRIAVTEMGGDLFTQARVATITHAEITGLVYDGFFPGCALSDKPQRVRAGLRELGLPYAADSAVTRHVADFLADRLPVDAILFNGGTFTPSALRDRLTEQVSLWQQDVQPSVLDNPQLYLAVARGAARFAAELALGRPRLISAGASHGFYMEIESGAERQASHLVCLLPLGADVEEPQTVTKLDLHLLVNQPVEFRVYSSVRRAGEHAGQIVKYDERDFHPLPPLHTIARLDTGRYRIRAESVPVAIESRLNALGLLQVFLVSTTRTIEPPHRWQLEFNIRKAVGPGAVEAHEDASVEQQLPENARAEAFGILGSRFDQGILSRLERVTGVKRQKWNRLWLREFWKPLSETIAQRDKGPDYEAAWLNAAGYFLRPGYGVALDDYRIEQLWNLYVLELAYPTEKKVREQYYILWRRVSGGLGPGQQQTLYDDTGPLIRSHVKQAAEAIRMACSFEYLSREGKEELFRELLAGVTEKPDKQRPPYLWGLGRLLGRVPLYAGEESIVPPEWVAQAFDLMQDWDWRGPGLEYAPTLFALACRKT